MDYLRRSVSLRAYGQRDPLIEYRREGLMRFKQLVANLAHAVSESIPHMAPKDVAAIRAEEEKVRAALVEAGKEGGSEASAPLRKAAEPGRNDVVTIKKGGETKQLKYKKAESLLSEGWELVT